MNYEWYESPWEETLQEKLQAELEQRVKWMQERLASVLDGDTDAQLKALDHVIEEAEILKEGIKYRRHSW